MTHMDRQLKQLNRLFAGMDQVGQQALLEYAEFLQTRHPQQLPIPYKPLDIERPAEESVVVAIKRLSRTYPMLQSGTLLHEASAMLTQHMIQYARERVK